MPRVFAPNAAIRYAPGSKIQEARVGTLETLSARASAGFKDEWNGVYQLWPCSKPQSLTTHDIVVVIAR